MARPQKASEPKPPAEPQQDGARVIEDPVKQMRDLISRLAPMFGNAFPGSLRLDPKRFVRVAINCIESDASGKLMSCSHGSIARALLHSAELGLEPGGALGHAYLIPYWNKDRGVNEAQFQIGVWGLIALARRSGEIVDVWARCVYEGDEFEEHGGSEPKLIHRPQPFAQEGRTFLGAYACAKFRDGTVNWTTVSADDCLRARKMNRGASPAWDMWPDEMRKKVAIRRAAKSWPKTVEDAEQWAKVLELEDNPLRALRPDLQEGLVRLLSTGPIGVPAPGRGLDAVVAARRAASADVATTGTASDPEAPPEPVRETQEPAAAPPATPAGRDYDPTTGEVPPEAEPPQREVGEEG